MNILAFDTGLNKTYLGLYTDGSLHTQTIESTKDKYHSAFLIKKIVEILKKNDIKMRYINLIATNAGPGSFTGIRVGLTIARGLAQALNISTTSVNSLELISQTYKNAITVLDARKNKAYFGNEKSVELIDLEILPDKLKTFKGQIITDTKMQKILSEHDIKSLNFENDNKNYAETLINLAIEKYNNGEYTNWQGLKPMYIQPPPIHTK